MKKPVLQTVGSAKQHYVVMSARKIRRVVALIKNKPVPEALNILHFLPHDAARLVNKKLVEAVSNAGVKYNLQPTDLVVGPSFADEATALKRVRPRAQGRMYRREKPMAHITVQVATAVKN